MSVNQVDPERRTYQLILIKRGEQQNGIAQSLVVTYEKNKRLPFNCHRYYIICRRHRKCPEEKPLVSEHTFQEPEDSTVFHHIDVFIE